MAPLPKRPGAKSAASPAFSKPLCRSRARFPLSPRVARDGAVECFDVTENEHRDHILKISRVPAALPEAAAREARRIAETIAQKFGYVGVLAVEMFELRDGGLLVNEIAPRVHNSGHWTLDGASVSQFEQHIRAVAGWPLAKPLRRGRVEMINLIGNEIEDYRTWLTVPGAAVHLYGKTATRPGRKWGTSPGFSPSNSSLDLCW